MVGPSVPFFVLLLQLFAFVVVVVVFFFFLVVPSGRLLIRNEKLQSEGATG